MNNFTQLVWDYYDQHKRSYPWRETQNPYHIWVSEIMLQQTQTDRTVPKYLEFIEIFPSIQTLAQAPQAQVLKYWKGLGYNRRALYLNQATQIIVKQHRGKIPQSKADLLKLPGIGPYTSSAILTFAFNQPLVFIETNVRTVFLHHFFRDQENIPDGDLMPLIEQTLDRSNPREWYYALMDYGSYLKKAFPNPNRKSKHYTKQSKFEGSNRQLRGKTLEYLLENEISEMHELVSFLDIPKERANKVITKLINEGFLVQDKNKIKLK